MSNLRDEIDQHWIAEFVAGLKSIELRVNGDFTNNIKSIVSEVYHAVKFCIRMGVPFVNKLVRMLNNSWMQATQIFERKCVV